MSFVTMLVNVDACRLRRATSYLSSNAMVLRCDIGVAVLTTWDEQVSINHLVPKCQGTDETFLAEVVAFVQKQYPTHAIDCLALRTLFVRGLPCERRRRLVASPACVKALVLNEDGTRVVRAADTSVAVDATVVPTLSREMCQRHRPLACARRDDECDTVYWHRFPCGRIATLCNPFLDLHAPIHLETPLPSFAPLLPHLHKHTSGAFVQALFPQTLDASLQMISCVHIPDELRRYFVVVAEQRFGISDLLLTTASKYLRPGCTDPYTFVSYAVEIGRLIESPPREQHLHFFTIVLATTLAACRPQFPRWLRWFMTSPFVFACVRCCSLPTLRAACKVYAPFRNAAALVLTDRMDAWTNDDVLLATFVVSTDTGNRDFAVIYDELKRREQQADVCAKEVSKQVTKPSKPPRRGGKKPWRSPTTVPDVTDSPDSLAVEAGTHHALATRLGAFVDMPAQLIGSGIFRDTGDADIVLTVNDSEPLEAAYVRIAKQTGWVARYEHVDDDHVAVLSGTFEQVKVDVQLWHGDATRGRAAAKTASAIALTRRLEVGADTIRREHVCFLHRLFDEACLKGHNVCRLSGIGVTCVAIHLSRHRRDTVEASSVLCELRALLTTETPCIDLDEDDTTTRVVAARPCAPLAVLAAGTNVASRLTAATTRHLLDAIAHACVTHSLTSHDWRMWRRRTMFLLGHVRPLEGDATVSKALHTALAKLDGNPLIESVHVDATDDSDCLTLLGNLRPDAPLRYALRSEDSLVRRSPHYVTVRRGNREWPLACTPRASPHVSPGCARSITDTVHIAPSVSAPHAATLTVDVLACFAPNQWEWCTDE